MRRNGRRDRRAGREHGGVLSVVMALLAAMTLTTALTARHVHRQGHRSRWIHLRAVARNLAAGAIAAARAGQPVPRDLAGRDLASVEVSVRLARRSLGRGRQQLTATAEVRTRTGRSQRLVYEITAVLQRSPGDRSGQLVSWRERRRPTADE